jgi:hypothetical protein
VETRAPSITMSADRHAFCPACDRFVGLVSLCPYCDAVQPRGMRVRRFCLLLFALTGCGLFVFATRHHVPPVMLAGSTTRTMSGAYVSIAGRVDRSPAMRHGVDGRDGLSFSVKDSSGRIQVFCPERVAESLLATQRVPSKNDAIHVSGRLSVDGDGSATLRCLSAGSLHSTAMVGTPSE